MVVPEISTRVRMFRIRVQISQKRWSFLPSPRGLPLLFVILYCRCAHILALRQLIREYIKRSERMDETSSPGEHA